MRAIKLTQLAFHPAAESVEHLAAVRDDVLRASVVLIHASLEDYLRSVAVAYAASDNEDYLKDVPLAGSTKVKFTVSDLG